MRLVQVQLIMRGSVVHTRSISVHPMSTNLIEVPIESVLDHYNELPADVSIVVTVVGFSRYSHTYRVYAV